jgi:hypothetical protein
MAREIGMSLHALAIKWGWSIEELRDVQTTLGLYTPPLTLDHPGHGKSEAWVQSAVRLEASEKGHHLARNNVGALPDKTGRIVRYGLLNDSAALNEKIKSGDLVGWRCLIITPQMVGMKIAQFLERECKEPGWQFNPNDAHQVAQLARINMVNAAGGDAAFVTTPGLL